eukprot:scaffold2306_cov132-Cylindrotheca_fusiformis.AAC.1
MARRFARTTPAHRYEYDSSENCQLSGFDREKSILGEGCAGTAPSSEADVRVCTEQWQEAKLCKRNWILMGEQVAGKRKREIDEKERQPKKQ